MTEEQQPSGKGKGTILVAVSLVAVIAVFVALLSLGGNDDDTTLKYNGFDFVNVNGLWQTTWERDGQQYILDFRNNPKQVEDVPVTGSVDVRFNLEPTYLAIDPPDEQSPRNSYIALALIELSTKLVDPFERNITAACTRNETDACLDRPIVTCDSVNSSVIYLKYEEPTKITLKGNCAVLQGTELNLVRAADKALFQWLGIMS